MRSRTVLGIVLVTCLARLVAVGPARGQMLHASAPLPSFEVATVKPWQPPPPPPPAAEGSPAVKRPAKVSPGGLGGQATDRVHAILPTNILIAQAFHVPLAFQSEIVGAPGWLGGDQYEIQAKIDSSEFAAMQTMTPAQQRERVDLMEQALLAERFKLKVHFETREMLVYSLVVAKGGAKQAAAKEGEVSRLSTVEHERSSEMTGVAVSMEQLTHSPLLAAGGHPVVDRTGMAGAYDFSLQWARPSATEAAQEGDLPAIFTSIFTSIFTAIQEQLGLRLVPGKAQVEVLMIDHIERPSEN